MLGYNGIFAANLIRHRKNNSKRMGKNCQITADTLTIDMEGIMKLGTTYIYVNNMQKSLDFYKALLQQEPAYTNGDRWVTFYCGNTFSLYYKHYDEKIISKEANEHFNLAYIDDFFRDKGPAKNNIVILNFEVENLKQEYDRLSCLSIGKPSDLMYVNIHMPYWYFNIEVPDGNTIEITGKYYSGG